MSTFDLRPWLTCVDTTFGTGMAARVSPVDVADLDVHDEDHREMLIRAQHPGLVAAIDDGLDEIVVHDEPVNPRLHLAVHEVVANQLAAASQLRCARQRAGWSARGTTVTRSCT